MSTKYIKSVLNMLCDLICDVITCFVLSFDMDKINASDKIMLKPKKGENVKIKEIFT